MFLFRRIEMWNPPDPTPPEDNQDNYPPKDWTEMNPQELTEFIIEKMWLALETEEDAEDIPF